jgi:glycosyltransferase involved in cell wall biosynthesis
MRILIYNKYMATMGGGEKHIGAVAEYLSYKHKVSILTDVEFDVDKFKKRLNVDLSNVEIIVKKTKDNIDVTRLTYGYDIFINSTYQSTPYGFAKKNILFLFFPINPHHHYPVFIKKNLRQFIENYLFSGYKFISPIYPIEKYNGKLGNWADNDICIFLNHSLNIRQVIISYIDIPKYPLQERIKTVEVNDVAVDYTLLDDNFIINIPFRHEKRDLKLKIELETINKPLSKYSYAKKLGLFSTNIAIKNRKKVNKYIGTYIQEKTKIAEKLYKYYGDTTVIDFVKSYDLVLSNSSYTQYWTKKILGVKSQILFPPIDTDIFKSSDDKKNYILSVGRFFVGSHNKKHLEMIQMFKKMYDENSSKLKGWEYHLCGGTQKERIHRIYLEMVKKEAEGYPIFIHEDIDLPSLIKLYSKSKMFWHASGFEENEVSAPEKFEHFGITTVEAMASGCVPVVINKAGQRQIVKDGENGYLWDSEEELIQKTLNLIDDEKLRITLSHKAIKRSKDFSRNIFNMRVEKIISSI